jgi:hypothetical protein
MQFVERHENTRPVTIAIPFRLFVSSNLQEAIGQALLTVTAQDAQGRLRHCGYLPAEGK